MISKKLRNTLLLALKITVSGLLLTFVLRKVGLQNILSHLRSMDLRFFFLSALIYILTVALASLRWGILLKQVHSRNKLFSLCLIGGFFNHFLPGAVGGDAMKAYYLYKETGHGGSSLGSVFLDRYVGYCALLSIGLIAGIAGYSDLKTLGLHWLTPALFVLFLSGSLVFFGLRIGRRFTAVADFYDYFHDTLRDRRALGKAFLLSLTIQLLNILEIYLISLGLGQHPSYTALFVFAPLIFTVTLIPISISGLGLREGAFVVLFGLTGISAEASTAISFLWFLSVATGSLVGLVEYMRQGKMR
ncbi:MAG: lysylphosphatidylglycerol synthase transmembrane domain-containing protein [Nitrospirota bacterium]